MAHRQSTRTIKESMVANPIHPSDAIPFKFLQEYARELYENVLRPTSEAYYYLDAEEY